jgi:hypothetical protein
LLNSGKDAVWPFWNPRLWQFEPTEREQIMSKIDMYLTLTQRPEYVVATDRQFKILYAAKQLNGEALSRLPAVFDGLPHNNSFDYWKEYIGLRNKIATSTPGRPPL